MAIGAISIILSCGDSGSDDDRRMRFELGQDVDISLTNANAYLYHSWVFTAGVSREEGAYSHQGRAYMITDGEYSSGDPQTFSNYTGATYYITFEIIIPASSEFEDGDFPLRADFFNFGSNSSGASFYYQTPSGELAQVTINDYDDLQIDGDMDGEFEVYAFIGSMEYSEVVGDLVDAEIYFEGTFDNIIAN